MSGARFRPAAAAAALLLATAWSAAGVAAQPPARLRTPAPSPSPSPSATAAATAAPAASPAAPISQLGSAPDYDGRPVAHVDVLPPRGTSAAELARFLEVRAGEPYSSRKVRRSIEVLSRLGDFSSIDVLAAESPAGLLLTFRILPVPRIRRVIVDGVARSAQAIARNALGVQAGEPYPGDQDLPRMADDVRHAFVEEGWREPHVEIKGVTLETNDVQLQVHIDAGPRIFIREVDFHGDFSGAFEEKELLAASGLKLGDPARKPALLEARRRLLALHRKLGYLEARIPEPQTLYDVEKPGFGRIVFVVNSGEQVSVEIHKGTIAWADQKADPFFWWSFRDSRLTAVLDLDAESQITD
ncbi:MAG TPA: POTRA domain-containing protein, partial [bacterium]|nr:POTRA domain-containing protein [bacterium]